MRACACSKLKDGEHYLEVYFFHLERKSRWWPFPCLVPATLVYRIPVLVTTLRTLMQIAESIIMTALLFRTDWLAHWPSEQIRVTKTKDRSRTRMRLVELTYHNRPIDNPSDVQKHVTIFLSLHTILQLRRTRKTQHCLILSFKYHLKLCHLGLGDQKCSLQRKN